MEDRCSAEAVINSWCSTRSISSYGTKISKAPSRKLITKSPSLEPATTAYNEALAFFQETFSSDCKSQEWISSKSTMIDVQIAVDEAKLLYEKKCRPTKVLKMLHKLSQRLIYYHTVFDTVANGAPEYASFGWGALKLLCTITINQEELTSKLSRGLVSIANALSHVELRIVLYPTEKMKKTVAMLYAHILKFLQRAGKWYIASRTKHVVSAILRPYALSFRDIQDEIVAELTEVDKLAVSANMAEQRMTHTEQREMHAYMRRIHEESLELNRRMQALQEQTLSITIDINKSVYEIQFSQILTFVSDASLRTPELSRAICQTMRDQRRRRTPRQGFQSTPINFLGHLPQLQSWAHSEVSSVLLVRGNFSCRHQAKDFAIDVIDLALRENIPTAWVLNPAKDPRYRQLNSVDVLKQLVWQGLKLNRTILDEPSFMLNAIHFQTVATEEEWLDLLGSVLVGLDRLYVVIDMECLYSHDNSEATAFSWCEAFRGLFQKLKLRGAGIVLKVVLVTAKENP